MNKKRDLLLLIIGYIGALAGCFGVIMFTRYVLVSFPLAAKLICLPIFYWLIALVPIILICITKGIKETLNFSKEKAGLQIVIGIISGFVIASAYFMVPYFFGFGTFVDNGDRYTRLYQFDFELIYYIIAVAAVEEIVFRGFIYSKLINIFENEWAAIIGSSVLFGLFHILNGNIIQVIITSVIGIIFCIFRLKIKNCTLLSLIFMHGVYDFILTLFSSLLFR